MKIYCTGCETEVEARLTSGEEIYPHRPDLHSLPFWRCDACENYVGCHHKTSNPTKPLGVIPTSELKRARQMIHEKLDPLWQSGEMSRREVYAKLSEALGKTYHTANIRSLEEAREVYRQVLALKKLEI